MNDYVCGFFFSRINKKKNPAASKESAAESATLQSSTSSQETKDMISALPSGEFPLVISLSVVSF